MKEHTYCVIMAGGVGSRFWPMSRSAHPKQFLDFLGLGRTLLQQTYDRFLPICPPENILVVTHARYTDLVRKQLPGLKEHQILPEPDRRNTAPCIAYANHVIAERDPEALIIVAPSDHLVLKEEAFQDTIRIALEEASAGDRLVTLGITPSRPDTGYGYIRFTDAPDTVDARVKKVKTFTEKPDHANAERFVASGDHLWNAGIFIWSLSSISKAFKQHLPELDAHFASVEGVYGTDKEHEAISRIYSNCESVSIDYGVMEKADNAYTVISDFGWSDLGTWGSLYDHLPLDAKANAAIGDNLKLYDCSGNMIHMHDDRLTILQGLDDYIVVSTKEALLVVRKQDEQKIKEFVTDLAAESGDRHI